MLTMTPQAWLALKEFAPRIFADRMKQPLGSRVTVVIYHSRETSAGFLAKTTFSIVTGTKPLTNAIEYSWVKGSRLSQPEKLGWQIIKKTPFLREYLVSTSPPTLRRVQNLRQEISFDGLQAVQSPE
nr:hypothetical protein [Nitrosomonas marina]